MRYRSQSVAVLVLTAAATATAGAITGFLVICLASMLAMALEPRGVHAAESGGAQTFSRRVGRLTGNPGAQGNVVGQDSPVWVQHEGETYVFFGDTDLAPKGQLPDQPNTGAIVRDVDPTDGLTLEYFVDGEGDAIPMIETNPGESTVWILGAFSEGGSLYAYFVSLECNDGCRKLSVGLAVMPEGGPPFERTELVIVGDEMPYFKPEKPFVDGEYLYFLPNRISYLRSDVYLMRVHLDHLMESDAYELWTVDGWSNDHDDLDARLQYVAANAAGFAIQYNPYLAMNVATTSRLYGGGGLNTALVHYVGEGLDDWGAPHLSFEADACAGFGPLYQPSGHRILDMDGGRLSYVGATEGEEYNVYLYEVAWDFARARYSIPDDLADGDEKTSTRKPKRPSLKRRALHLSPRGRRVVALRFEGNTYQYSGGAVSDALTTARLTLPLVKEARKSALLPLEISVGVPFSEPYSARTRGDISSRATVGDTILEVAVEAGDHFVTIDDDRLREAIASYFEAYRSNGHRLGDPSRLDLFLRNLDSRERLLLEARSISRKQAGASLDLCFGLCPPPNLDLDRDGAVEVVCIDDSDGDRPGSWCSAFGQLSSALGYRVSAYSIPAASASVEGSAMLDDAIDQHAPDVVALALGMHDLATLQISPAETAEAIRQLVETSESRGLQAYAFNLPPVSAAPGSPLHQAIESTNRELLRVLPARKVIDIHSVGEPRRDSAEDARSAASEQFEKAAALLARLTM